MPYIKYSAIASGIKAYNKLDLAIIILPENTNTACVFTKNVFCAAPIIVAKNHINNNIRALIINSGNANAGTGIASGDKGIVNAYYICEILADELGVSSKQILPFSTGVIGEQLPIKCFENSIKQLVTSANNNDLQKVASAILTTDTCEKIVAKTINFNGKKVNITGIAKGSGMICPNMATMLSFITTDATINDNKQLQNYLQIAVNKSFNRITIDGDTSTNDAVSLSATGTAGVNIIDIEHEFISKLNETCQELALKIVKDGEGATKLVKISVLGGNSNDDCLEVAYTVAHSPLVKTALFASDANIGRLLMAVGRANIKNLAPQNVDILINNLLIVKNGLIAKDYNDTKGSIEMAKKNIAINIKIGNKNTIETIWTTDLSHEYVRINSDYRS